MSPEFDPKKNAINIGKHGLSLSAGDGVLLDPSGITIEDDTAKGEYRWITTGANVFGEIMVVVWTDRHGDARLISVRKATPKERRTYES